MDSNQKELKKQWKARERAEARSRFPLPDDELATFFAHVERRCQRDGCDHTRRFTDEWLAARGFRTEAVIAWLEEHGGFCDCEVANNVVDHWADNRLGAHKGDEPDS